MNDETGTMLPRGRQNVLYFVNMLTTMSNENYEYMVYMVVGSRKGLKIECLAATHAKFRSLKFYNAMV